MSETCEIVGCGKDGIPCTVPGRLGIRLCSRHAVDMGFCPICGFHMPGRERSERWANSCKDCERKVKAAEKKE